MIRVDGYSHIQSFNRLTGSTEIVQGNTQIIMDFCIVRAEFQQPIILFRCPVVLPIGKELVRLPIYLDRVLRSQAPESRQA